MQRNTKKRTRPDSPAKELERELIRESGAVIGGDSLRRHLGFRSMDAMQKAFKYNRLTLTAFEMPPRRGRFVLASDLAAWLIRRRSEGAAQAQRALMSGEEKLH